MKLHEQQEGFAIFELVIAVVVLALVVGSGAFLWHRHNTNSSMSSTAAVTPAKQAQSASSALKSVDLASLKSSVDQIKSVVAGISSQGH